MVMKANSIGKAARAGLMVLGLGVMAAPFAAALATAEDPTQAPAEEELTAEQVAASRALFQQYSCGACHVLGDAGGTGHIGPSFDGNATLSVDFVTQRINNGQGAMPSFGGMIGDDEVTTLARYIVSAKAD